MRTFILAILLAGVAASPAIAQDHGRWHHDDAQGDARPDRETRQQQHEKPREQRAGAAVDQAPVPQQAQPDRAPQIEMRQNAGGGFEGRRFEQHDNVQAGVQAPPPPPEQRQFDGRDRANWNGGERRGWNGDRHNWNGSGQVQSGDLRQSDRPVPNVMRDRNPLIVSQVPREGTQPPPRSDSRRYAGNDWSGNWANNWRNNSRYDWRHYRDRHRSIFRLGFYYDPFGWQYRPYQIGWRLWPSYYSRNYWIGDPWQYRLPYAPPGTVWVRYWDDALLVDTYTGEVIDVIHDFFW